MNVLCVNHTGAISGAERSLLDLLSGLRHGLNVRLACPAVGPLAGAARSLDIPVDEIPGTDGSLKLHARETPRALGRLSTAAVRTARHARRMHADVIHANSIRAGLLTVPAARLAGAGAVVHVRDRLPRTNVADASLWLLATGAEIVAANSRYTEQGVRVVTPRGRVRVVHNPVDLDRFDSTRLAPAAMRAQLGLSHDTIVLAVVGQITPWKGQLEAVQAVGQLLRTGRDVHLLIVGEPKFVTAATRYDNRAYYRELERAIVDAGAGASIRMLGERQDIPDLMGAVDAVLVPSWEEPFGRVVVEAMSLGRTVVATDVGGPAEIITNGVDGVLVPPRDPDRWAAELTAIVDSDAVRARLGAAAKRRAQDFALPRHVDAMCELYREAIQIRHGTQHNHGISRQAP